MRNKDHPLEATLLVKQFGHHRVLAGVDLSIAAGEVVVIFGANGAGKSTLMRILATLLKPDGGQLHIAGQDVQSGLHQLRPQIGLIAHQPHAYLAWSPYQNLRFLGKMYGVEDLDARITGLLQDLGLLTYAHEPLDIFSRGMVQRFMIARALIHDPPILLFDEPFSGLDAKGQDFVAKLIAKLKSAGKTIVLTTHVTALGYVVADRYLVLSKGHIEFLGHRGALSLEMLETAYQERLNV